jgi:putative SOS response-associated peptidase YedK
MDFMRYDDGCGRYVLNVKAKDLKKRYNLAKELKDIPHSFDVKPTHTMPVITATEGGKPQLEMMKWGLIPSWWKKTEKMPFSTFNARDDRVFSSGVWRSIYRKRVLVPATGYFEWTKPEKDSKKIKQKFYFHPKQLNIFSFAGFYDVWKDVEDKEVKTYTLITTEPNKEARAIHDRMPVILHPEDEPKWLEPSRVKREDIEPFLHPLEDKGLEIYEVDRDATEWEYDDERRIAQLNSR